MASPERSFAQRPVQPAGAEGDGLDAYPTYHDGSTPGEPARGSKPTDVALPRARRTFSLPMLIGLLVFALVVLIPIIWSALNLATSTDEGSMSADPANQPTAAAPAEATAPAAGIDVPENDSGANGDGQAQPATGPGEVTAEPGPADVPGGATTTPVTPAPAE